MAMKKGKKGKGKKATKKAGMSAKKKGEKPVSFPTQGTGTMAV